MCSFFSFRLLSMIPSLNEWIIYLSVLFTIIPVDLMLKTAMLAYLFITVISIHDGSSSSFIYNSVLYYLYEKMILVSNEFTMKTSKLNIYFGWSSILVYFRKFGYEVLQLSYSQHEMLSNMYELMIHVYTEYYIWSLKWIFPTVILACFLYEFFQLIVFILVF